MTQLEITLWPRVVPDHLVRCLICSAAISSRWVQAHLDWHEFLTPALAHEHDTADPS